MVLHLKFDFVTGFIFFWFEEPFCLFTGQPNHLVGKYLAYKYLPGGIDNLFYKNQTEHHNPSQVTE